MSRHHYHRRDHVAVLKQELQRHWKMSVLEPLEHHLQRMFCTRRTAAVNGDDDDDDGDTTFTKMEEQFKDVFGDAPVINLDLQDMKVCCTRVLAFTSADVVKFLMHGGAAPRVLSSAGSVRTHKRRREVSADGRHHNHKYVDVDEQEEVKLALAALLVELMLTDDDGGDHAQQHAWWDVLRKPLTCAAVLWAAAIMAPFFGMQSIMEVVDLTTTAGDDDEDDEKQDSTPHRNSRVRARTRNNNVVCPSATEDMEALEWLRRLCGDAWMLCSANEVHGPLFDLPTLCRTEVASMLPSSSASTTSSIPSTFVRDACRTLTKVCRHICCCSGHIPAMKDEDSERLGCASGAPPPPSLVLSCEDNIRCIAPLGVRWLHVRHVLPDEGNEESTSTTTNNNNVGGSSTKISNSNNDEQEVDDSLTSPTVLGSRRTSSDDEFCYNYEVMEPTLYSSHQVVDAAPTSSLVLSATNNTMDDAVVDDADAREEMGEALAIIHECLADRSLAHELAWGYDRNRVSVAGVSYVYRHDVDEAQTTTTATTSATKTLCGVLWHEPGLYYRSDGEVYAMDVMHAIEAGDDDDDAQMLMEKKMEEELA